MIQAPQVQYMQTPLISNQQTGAVNSVPTQAQAPAVPGTFYNYPTSSAYLPGGNTVTTDKAQYNGVNIEILNPQGMGIPMTQQMPAQMYPVQQPIYIPQYNQPVQQPPIQQVPVQQIPTPIVTEQPAALINPQPVANTPVQTVPEPQLEQTNANPAQNTTPVINEPVAADPSLSPETFAGKLKTDNLQEQQNTLENLAKVIKEDDNAAPALLDTQVFDALVDIINKDTSALESPTPEVTELRNKPEAERTPEENEKANTVFPLEQAESNKQYALYTISFMQERLNSELVKRGGSILPLNELPCIDNVIEAAKSNPDPMVRAAGIASLSYIARPEYKDDLNTIFELAKSDEDPDVKAAAEKASQALNVK